MSILSLIASGNFISVNRDLIKVFGIETALLLGELASEYDYHYKRNELTDGCFYSTVHNIKENTGLSEHQQRQAFKILQEQGIVDIQKKGLPAKRYVHINEQVFLNVYDKWCKNYSTGALKNEALDVEKLKINNNIINDNIINNINSCVNKWNTLPDPIPKVKRLTTARKSKLSARLKDFGAEELIRAIDLINQSSFLKGKNKNGWFITFDWFLEPRNITKILEGNFTEQKPDKLQTKPSFDISEIERRAIMNDDYDI